MHINFPSDACLNCLILYRKKFTFRDDESIICCPVIFIVALAIADNAFKNKFTSLRQIYDLVVPKGTDRIRLKWDDDWAKRPIFRDVEQTPTKVQISKTKSFPYAKHRYYFVRLGRTCCFRKRLQWYDLRRGSGKGLNGENDLLQEIC
ncbi:MAG: hypothetical protein CL912_17140 [Deltaproteobacteria bacterium]|nr:hypothetical protein [Deltaproteobacteria bacterium]